MDLRRHPNDFLNQSERRLITRQVVQDEDVQTDNEILKQNQKECIKDLRRGITEFLQARDGTGNGGEQNPSWLVYNIDR